MTYRPLFVPASAEALERAGLDRWFGVPMNLPPDCASEWYAWRRRVRDSSWCWYGSAVAWPA